MASTSSLSSASTVLPGRLSKRKAIARKSPGSTIRPRSRIISLVISTTTVLSNDRALGSKRCPPLPDERPPSPVKAFIPIRHSSTVKLTDHTDLPQIKTRGRRAATSVPPKTVRAAKSPPAVIEPPSARRKRTIDLLASQQAPAGRMKRAASTQAMEHIQANQAGNHSDTDEPAQKKRRMPPKRAASLGPTSPLAKSFAADALTVPGHSKLATRPRSRLASPLSAGNSSGEDESPNDQNGYSTRQRSGRAREGPGHLRDYEF